MSLTHESILTPAFEFSRLAADEQIARTIQSLEAHNIQAMVVENSSEARAKVAELIPAGAEVLTASSVTLNQTGIAEDINNSGRYDALRVKLAKYDRKTQGREMNKMGAIPEYVIGSVHAVTETGSVIIASRTGSQLSSYVAGAAKVIWVVGVQKIVPDLEAGMRRVEEYTLPLEDERALKTFGVHSSIDKLLLVHRETTPGRITVIFIKENLGF